MNQENFIEQIKKISREIMSCGKMFHDYVHVQNVYSNIKTLLEHEQGDETALLTAALLHDIKRECNNHGTEGAIYAKEILCTIQGTSEEFINKVCEIIYAHDKEGIQDTLDKKIFYDADKMDAFSELGLIRSFMMYALDNLTVQESCNRYIQYIDSMYNNLFTNAAKQLVYDDYLNNKDKILKILMNYKDDDLKVR